MYVNIAFMTTPEMFACVLCSSGLVKAPLKRSRSTADGADEDSQDQLQEQLLESGGPEEEQRTDNTSLLRLLEEGEKVRQPNRKSLNEFLFKHLIHLHFHCKFVA